MAPQRRQPLTAILQFNLSPLPGKSPRWPHTSKATVNPYGTSHWLPSRSARMTPLALRAPQVRESDHHFK